MHYVTSVLVCYDFKLDVTCQESCGLGETCLQTCNMLSLLLSRWRFFTIIVMSRYFLGMIFAFQFLELLYLNFQNY